MRFRPLHDRVVVRRVVREDADLERQLRLVGVLVHAVDVDRRVEQEEKTAGGIIIPDTAKEKPMEGEVIAVGSGARGEDGKVQAMDVKAGDRILFGKWSGTEIKLDGEELLIMKESDIMGVIEPSAGSRKKKAA